jgi:hypothetical protein
MIEALALYRPGQPLHVCILPRRPWRNRPIPDAQPAQTPLHHLAIDGVTVAHEISWCVLPRERFHNLPSDPLRSRMTCHRMMNELPSAVRQDDQAIQQPEANRRHDEEICGGDPVFMVAQERGPALTGSAGAPTADWPTSMPSLSSSPWIRGAPHNQLAPAYLSDQLPDLLGDRRSATSGSRLPAPESSKSSPMPADYRLWSDDREGSTTAGQQR